MTAIAPPKFEKKNHHWVPQFWMNHFRDSQNQLWKRSGGTVTPTATDTIMAEHWLYTEFDQLWRPSDAVEDWFARQERQAGKLFISLSQPGHQPSNEEWIHVTYWLALTACRHPVVMRRSLERAKRLAFDLADVGQSPASFSQRLRDMYRLEVPEGLHAALAAKGEEALLEEATQIEGLSPQDPQLPSLLALTGVKPLTLEIAKLDLAILEAPPGSTFVLGDTPVPLKDLKAGFATPLTKLIAVGAWPNGEHGLVLRDRKSVSPQTVALVNAHQAEQSQSVVVGPSKAELEAL